MLKSKNILQIVSAIFLTAAILSGNNFLPAQDINKLSLKDPLHKSLKNPKPNLNGHNFSVTPQTKSPFIKTSIDIAMGLGQTVGLKPIEITIDTITVSKNINGNLVLSGLYLEFETKLREWLSFWVNFQINDRLGTNGSTLFAEGLNLSIGYEFGWMFKLWEDKKNILSGSFNLSNSSITIMSIDKYIRQLIENGIGNPENSLIYTVPSLSFVGGLRYATAFNKSLGLIALAEIGYGEKINSDNEGIFMFNGGATFDYDLMPKTNIPIGFSLGYYQNSYSRLSDQKISNPQNILGQISYTGKPDLSLGLVISYSWSKIQDSKYYTDAIKFLSFQGNFKYYF
ncbi:MAG: hypothetical protein JNJ56_02960 [Ignavibacteria bacterium]|nr:hypothetical protein [Ignavibacteria bacterium]